MDPIELLESSADEALLGDGRVHLPASVGRPEVIPPSRTRGRVVGAGAMLTGGALIGGIALLVVGVIRLATGGTVLGIVALALGAMLVGTHWGWVHVAEATANALDARRNAAVLDRRGHWLASIKPYTRYEVTTAVDDDGSIRIVSTCYRPVRSGPGVFSFAEEIEREEVYSGDEPAAAVAERAELRRREAAAKTEHERSRFEAAADAYETALLGRDDEQQRLEARRAASKALSEQINTNLRQPPLIE